MSTPFFIKNPRLFYISMIVIGVHTFFLVWAAYSPLKKRHPIENRQMIVQTITLQPASKIATQASSRPIAQPSPKSMAQAMPKPISKPPPKSTIQAPPKSISKVPEKKTTSLAKKDIPKSAPKQSLAPVNKKMEQLLASAKSQIDKIQSNKGQISSQQLQVPKWKTQDEPSHSYQEQLVSFLKSTLCLPEHGQVDIQLTLERNGKIKKLKILSSDSKKNQAYIEEMMRDMNFPPFSLELQGSKEFTFHFQLSGNI